MSRMVRMLAVGVALAGLELAISSGDPGDTGVWLKEQYAVFLAAAARGAAARPEDKQYPRGGAVFTAGWPLKALSVRVEDNATVHGDQSGAAQDPLEGMGAGAHARIPQIAPRPVATQLAEARGPQSDAKSQELATSNRQDLVQAIQKELRRVGCYQGALDGDWDIATRKAMKSFIDRVNASLPLAQPDYILLMLVQGHAAKACGAACPIGQGEARDGTCQPSSVLAEARRRASANSVVSSTEHVRREAIASASTVLELPTDSRAARTSSRHNNDLAEPQAPYRTGDGDPRIKRERELIAAAEERRRQRIAEAKARADAERIARMAEIERAWAAAESRRRDEISARAALGAKPNRNADAIASPESTPSEAAASKVRPSVGPGQSALVQSPPVGATFKSTTLTRPADARFVGRYFPPPTYRIGRLPSSPDLRVQPSAPKSRPSPAVTAKGARLQGVFRSVDRHSP